MVEIHKHVLKECFCKSVMALHLGINKVVECIYNYFVNVEDP